MEKMWFKSREVIRSIFTHEENHTTFISVADLQAEITRLKKQNQRLKNRLNKK